MFYYGNGSVGQFFVFFWNGFVVLGGQVYVVKVFSECRIGFVYQVFFLWWCVGCVCGCGGIEGGKE